MQIGHMREPNREGEAFGQHHQQQREHTHSRTRLQEEYPRRAKDSKLKNPRRELAVLFGNPNTRPHFRLKPEPG
jgi:hypothetical protein